MQCAVCGHKNPAGARTCASCGAALGLSATGTPISGTPGVLTGHTGAVSGSGAPNSGVYSPILSKGVRLQGGNYAVGELLGQGGFGITYKGGDLSLRRYVALKEFFPQGCARQGALVMPGGTLSAADYAGVKSKFIEEARTLARFSDPGIVRVFGVFEENNTAYMVMEFLEGQTLSKRISDKGTLGEAEVVGIAEKIGAALDVVHQTGLIHRDIKPDNICLTNDNRVVLIDFGTARAFASGKTVKHTTLLTPGYAPLEQYGSEARFGAYTDIYALSATLYQCLTGQIPPQATDRASGVELKAPQAVNPNVSRGVSDALMWGMQVKASERPQNIKAFLAAFKSPSQSVPAPGSTALVTPPPMPAPGWGGSPIAPTPFSSPLAVPQAGYASIQLVGDEQILSNALPQDVVGAVQRAFQSAGVANSSVDAATYRVFGSTSAYNSAQNVVAQVTQDARGTLVTLSVAAGATGYSGAKDETRRLMAAVQGALQTLPATPSYTPAPYGGPNYPPPIAYPQGGYQVQSQPLVRMQGGSVLTMALLGLFCCGFCAPIAWINANSALKEYGDRDPGDRGTLVAGRVIGIIGTAIWGLYLSGVFLSALGS